MDLMKELPDNSVDLAIVDPQYGIGESGLKNNSRSNLLKATDYGVTEWDSAPPNPEYFESLRRVSKHQIIWGANHFGFMMPSPNWIVWDKKNGNNDFADGELAYCSIKGAVRIFPFRWSGMRQENMRHKEKRIHLTQKPKALYRWLMQKYWKPGWTLLDTHVGSANSLAVFEEFGATYWASELDKDYYNAGLINIAKHKSYFTTRSSEEINIAGGQKSIFDEL